ncbi:MAG: glycosyltransferase [Desulfomonilaceae bacterium]
MDDGQKREALENLNCLFKYSGEPLIDVIVTNYNYAQFIGACLESIAAQDYPNWRCTVVDDASGDNSVAVIEGFVQENPERFSLIRQERNAGQMEAFKTGLAATSGDFVLFVDSDDLILPQCMTMHLAAHFYLKDVAFTCSALARINENAALISGHFPSFPYDGSSSFVFLEPATLFKPYWPWTATSAMLFRRAAIQWAIPADTSTLALCADNYLANIAHLLGGSALIPEVLTLYRLHQSNNFATRFVLGTGSWLGPADRHMPWRETRKLIASQLMEQAEVFSIPLLPRGLLMRLLMVSDLRTVLRNRKSLERVGIGPVATLTAFLRFRLLRLIRDKLGR